jgi:dihydrofolate synthase/folylpolyglutamate synthase
MKLQKIIERLQKLHKKKIDLSLDRTFSLLKKLGNPQDKLKNIITVAGTNAKASMCYTLKAILNEAGYKVNLYTSPHLQSYTERFIFNDKEISEENLIELLNDIEKTLGEDNATVFEILTCAFLKQAEQFKDNINIIEAGLFHQYDATNVFSKNLASVIGYTHYDHISWLKNKTIDGIIHEKTAKLLNSNIFVNQQENKNIAYSMIKAITAWIFDWFSQLLSNKKAEDKNCHL